MRIGHLAGESDYTIYYERWAQDEGWRGPHGRGKRALRILGMAASDPEFPERLKAPAVDAARRFEAWTKELYPVLESPTASARRKRRRWLTGAPAAGRMRGLTCST